MTGLLRVVLLLDAAFCATFGLLFASAPYGGVFELLQLQQPQPAYYSQLFGLALLAISLIQLRAVANRQLIIAMASTVGWLNLASAILIIVWIVLGMFVTAATPTALGAVLIMLVLGLVQLRGAGVLSRREKIEAAVAKAHAAHASQSAAQQAAPQNSNPPFTPPTAS
ncbi:MAG: hypothetical protein MO853_14070 [Candidatus Protistobacter heckmanni]|nr:hypothetical protein [Candidatus Protistobacter heckmanni]